MHPKTVAILTNFTDLNPGYSLTGIVLDQCRMLLRHGHRVVLCVGEKFAYFNGPLDALASDYFGKFAVEKKSKAMSLRDYPTSMLFIEEHKIESKECAEMYVALIKKHQVEVVFTHDFIFTGWNLPYAAAVKQASEMLSKDNLYCRWLHWIHSVPCFPGKDWWNLSQYGPDHHIVFPNRTELKHVADSFSTNETFVHCIPHIKDMRTWYRFGSDSCRFLDTYPDMMSADIVQVYPCSTDRLEAKQLDVVIKMFGYFKELQNTVFLCIANQWATGLQRKESVEKYIQLGTERGLEYGKDFVFTSMICQNDFYPYSTGIGTRMLFELQLLSNLFIFPTREESFGLVAPEAAFSGALVITNKSLAMMAEVMGGCTPSYGFGSFYAGIELSDDYLRAVSLSVLNTFFSNDVVTAKSFCRQRYNMENCYYRYYLPIIGG